MKPGKVTFVDVCVCMLVGVCVFFFFQRCIFVHVSFVAKVQKACTCELNGNGSIMSSKMLHTCKRSMNEKTTNEVLREQIKRHKIVNVRGRQKGTLQKTGIV